MPRITEIQYSSDPHQLILTRAETPYYCYGYQELGFDPCYQCNERQCNFHLHEECAAANLTATNHLFITRRRFVLSSGELKLIFYKVLNGSRSIGSCVACGKGVHGYRYHSLCEKGYVLHPCCLKLPYTMTNNEVSLILQKKAPSKCLKCQRKKVSDNIEGWAYVSTCGNYCYHVKCVKELVLEKWKEVYFRVPSNDQGNQDTLHLVVEHGSLTGRRARRIDLSKVKAVLGLIVSAIFGNVLSTVIGGLLLPLFLDLLRLKCRKNLQHARSAVPSSSILYIYLLSHIYGVRLVVTITWFSSACCSPY